MLNLFKFSVFNCPLLLFERRAKICLQRLNFRGGKVAGLKNGHLLDVYNVRLVHDISDDQVGRFSYSEVKKFVKNYYRSVSEGHACLLVDCDSCAGKNGGVPNGKMTVNMKTGYCFCTHCHLHGPWSRFEEYLKARGSVPKNSGCEELKNFMSSYSLIHPGREQVRKLWNSANSVESVPERDLCNLLEKLNMKDITLNTLKKYSAKVELDSQKLILPVGSPATLDYHGIRIISPTNLENSDNMTDSDDEDSLATRPDEINIPQGHPWLLGYNLYNNKDHAVLTSSAADALIASQHLPATILCLPAGISHLPQATLALLEQFRRVTLWLDNGIPGWESSRVFATKLGEKRCHLIRPTADTPSPLQCKLSGKDLVDVLNTSQPAAHKSVTTFASLRDDVYAEISQKDNSSGIRWRRFPILNDLLKGHRRGELTIFTGPTGTGKTTFISEYSLDLCVQNVNTLWGSFEIRNVRLAKMMLQQFAGSPLSDEPKHFAQVADQFEKIPMFFLTFHGQQSVKAVLEAMAHAVYVHDIAHVIIDNLQFMMGTSDSGLIDRFWKQDQIIGSFRQFATFNNVHVTIVIHPRKEEADELTASSIFGGAKASQEADNIIILQEKRIAGSDQTIRRKYLQVAKNRYTGDLGTMPLEFHKESLSFSSQRKKLPMKIINANKSSSATSPPSPT